MAKRHGSFSRLIIMIVIAAILFIGLALGEDYVRGFLAGRTKRAVVTGATSDVGKAVKRYNQIIVRVYAQDKPSLLESVATNDRIQKVRLNMTYDQVEEKRKMVVKLKALSLNKTEKKKKKAKVLTTETWEYHYEDLNTKKIFGQKTETYNVTYDLVKTKGRWFISVVDAKTL